MPQGFSMAINAQIQTIATDSNANHGMEPRNSSQTMSIIAQTVEIVTASAIKFVTLTMEVVDSLIQHGLTKAESKLFFFLMKLDPFGDRPIKMKVAEILLATGIKKTAYHQAIVKFEDLGWFDFKHTDVSIRNTSCRSKGERYSAKTDSAKTNSSPKPCDNSAKTAIHLEKRSERHLEILPSNDSGTPQTLNPDNIIKIRSDRSLEFFEEEEKETKSIAQPLPTAIAIKIESKSDLEEKGIETPKKVISPIEVDPARRELEDFILKSRKLTELSLESRKNYLAKLSPENWADWQAKFKPNTCQPVEYRNPIAGDPWKQQGGINSAIVAKDYDEAKCRIEILSKTHPEMANTLRDKLDALLF